MHVDAELVLLPRLLPSEVGRWLILELINSSADPRCSAASKKNSAIDDLVFLQFFPKLSLLHRGEQ